MARVKITQLYFAAASPEGPAPIMHTRSMLVKVGAVDTEASVPENGVVLSSNVGRSASGRSPVRDSCEDSIFSYKSIMGEVEVLTPHISGNLWRCPRCLRRQGAGTKRRAAPQTLARTLSTKIASRIVR